MSALIRLQSANDTAQLEEGRENEREWHDLLSSDGIIKIAKREILRRLIDVESHFLHEQILCTGAGDGGAEEFPVGLIARR